MAYATQDQVLNYLQEGKQEQGVDPTASRSMGSSGGSGIVSTGAPSAAPQGTGGSQQWTNIQNYLTANEGQNKQRADTVKQQASGIFGQEKSQFEQKAQEAKSSAEKATEPVRSVNQDAASKLISEASSAQKGSEGYTKAIDPLKKAVNTQIAPAQTFSYGLGGEAQEVGGNLGQGKFSNFLGMFDKKLQGGRDLSTGQRALQGQLDVQNTDLEAARQGLESEYAGLQKQVDTGAVDTNKYVQDLTSGAMKAQGDLRSYLEGQGGQSRADIDAAIAAHNQQFDANQKSFNDYTSQVNALRDQLTNAKNTFRQPDTGSLTVGTPGFNPLYNRNLTEDQIRSLRNDISQQDMAAAMGTDQENDALFSRALRSYDDKKSKGFAIDKNNPLFAMVDYFNKVRANPDYQAGQRADETTIGGKANQDRRRYNAIMDIFGKSGIEDKEDAATSRYLDNIKWGI
jgi:hypothetical protein